MPHQHAVNGIWWTRSPHLHLVINGHSSYEGMAKPRAKPTPFKQLGYNSKAPLTENNHWPYLHKEGGLHTHNPKLSRSTWMNRQPHQPRWPQKPKPNIPGPGINWNFLFHMTYAITLVLSGTHSPTRVGSKGQPLLHPLFAGSRAETKAEDKKQHQYLKLSIGCTNRVCITFMMPELQENGGKSSSNFQKLR